MREGGLQERGIGGDWRPLYIAGTHSVRHLPYFTWAWSCKGLIEWHLTIQDPSNASEETGTDKVQRSCQGLLPLA